MFNLHSHSLLSDGVLLPSELCVRYADAGYKALAITDHADHSNIEEVISAVRRFCGKWPKKFPLRVIPGVELTHLPLEQFRPLVKYCRRSGIKVIVGHGETLAEPVLPGTNRACLEAGVDILAHPGRLSDHDARLAAKKGIFLEITTRKSHRRTNREVASQAIKFNAPLVINHDSHEPGDIISPAATIAVCRSCGLSGSLIKQMISSSARLAASLIKT